MTWIQPRLMFSKKLQNLIIPIKNTLKRHKALIKCLFKNKIVKATYVPLNDY